MQQPALPFDKPPLKRCSTCRELKPLSEFHRDRSRRDGRQNNCRPCNIEINKRWYRDHPEARPERMDGYAKRRRRKNEERILEYLRAHPCVDCGERDPVVLEFDHLRDKIANVSAMHGSPWWKILAEIAKCEVVCANCHRRRTMARIGGFRYLVSQGVLLVGAVGLEPTTNSLKGSRAANCATPPSEH